MNYFYIFGTIVFTVYGQLILKWRIAKYGTLPLDFFDKLVFLIKLLFDPFILSGFIGAFIASLCWMAAMTKFDISFAYPFMGLSFVLILVSSGIMFHEPITVPKIICVVLIIAGIVMGSRS